MFGGSGTGLFRLRFSYLRQYTKSSHTVSFPTFPSQISQHTIQIRCFRNYKLLEVSKTSFVFDQKFAFDELLSKECLEFPTLSEQISPCFIRHHYCTRENSYTLLSLGSLPVLFCQILSTTRQLFLVVIAFLALFLSSGWRALFLLMHDQSCP